VMVEQQQPQGSSSVSSGSLRTKISLKGGYSAPLATQTSPFYGMKPELPTRADLIGSDDLLAQFDLSGVYKKYCSMDSVSEDLASFLPQVCGSGSLNSRGDETCSLRRLVENPPRTRNEIRGLSASAMVGFKLTPGTVPESYRLFDTGDAVSASTSAGPSTTSQAQSKEYQEFGKDYNDSEEVKAKNRKRGRRSLDELEDANEKKAKRHRGEEKEKEKKQKKKKKEKKKKDKRTSDDEESKRSQHKRAPSPFY